MGLKNTYVESQILFRSFAFGDRFRVQPAADAANSEGLF
jgi:hypothetical protein